MADTQDRTLRPESDFKALLKRLIDTPKAALDKLEAERQKRPRPQKPRMRYGRGSDFRATLGTPDEWIWIFGFSVLIGAIAGLDAALLTATVLLALFAIGRVLE